MSDRIWIAWENQRRSIELAKHFRCEFHMIDYSGKLRYIYSIISTFKILFKQKPKILFVQNPSMILATLACLYKLISNTFIVVDRHTTFRLNKPKTGSLRIRIFIALHKFTIRNADLTIITNDHLAELVKNMGGTPFILPDKLPEFPDHKKVKLKGKNNFLIVSSFGKDEPIDHVLKSANEIGDRETHLYISGNYKKLPRHTYESAPDNIIFTGFMSEEEYVDMLFSVDGVIVLTTSDYTMLCGCYEAVSAEKPLITSKKEVLEDYFSGAIFVENTSEDIARGIKSIVNDRNFHANKTIDLKRRITESWNNTSLRLDKLINSQISN